MHPIFKKGLAILLGWTSGLHLAQKVCVVNYSSYLSWYQLSKEFKRLKRFFLSSTNKIGMGEMGKTEQIDRGLSMDQTKHTDV